MTTQAVWGRKPHNCPSVIAQEKRPFLFFTKKKWHLSQVQRGIGGFTSPILFLPSSSCRLVSSPPPPSCWKRKGGRGVGGEEDPPATDNTVGSLFSSAFTSLWGSGCYWFSFTCDLCLSLSNSEQGRQEATPPGSLRCVRMV